MCQGNQPERLLKVTDSPSNALKAASRWREALLLALGTVALMVGIAAWVAFFKAMEWLANG
jgi:hypothetical protein